MKTYDRTKNTNHKRFVRSNPTPEQREEFL